MKSTMPDFEPLRGRALLEAQGRILVALMLRDIRTRFFGKAWGFLIAIAWPLSHILILLGIYALLGRSAPYGESTALWFATGIIPFMAFSYMSRFISLGVLMNRPLLTYPVVFVMDIIFSRAVVEALSAVVVVVIVCSLFWIMGIEFMPALPVEAVEALLASMLLGLGVGVVSAVVTGIIPYWATGYGLLMIVLWITSGVVFVPSALPENLKNIIFYPPVLHCVEWMRSAYYDDYGLGMLDKKYLLWWGGGALFVGMAMERLFRGRVMLN
mgnify:CR=1 FL=1